MATLTELKDWIEKGGKVRYHSWNTDEWMVKNDCGSFVDDVGMSVDLDADLILSDDWRKAEDKSMRWKPASGDRYYIVEEIYPKGVIFIQWYDDSADYRHFNAYNCFKTEEEAEHARDLWLAERELRSLADGGYYGIYYNIDAGSFIGVSSNFYSCPYQFSTKEKAEEAIEQLGEDKLKLIFGIK